MTLQETVKILTLCNHFDKNTRFWHWHKNRRNRRIYRSQDAG